LGAGARVAGNPDAKDGAVAVIGIYD